jgi:hypothetical protein
VLAVKDVLLEAEDDENHEDGPGGNVEKAVRLHPQSPLFNFGNAGKCRRPQVALMARSILGVAHHTIPSTGFCKRILDGAAPDDRPNTDLSS